MKEPDYEGKLCAHGNMERDNIILVVSEAYLYISCGRFYLCMYMLLAPLLAVVRFDKLALLPICSETMKIVTALAMQEIYFQSDQSKRTPAI